MAKSNQKNTKRIRSRQIRRKQFRGKTSIVRLSKRRIYGPEVNINSWFSYDTAFTSGAKTTDYGWLYGTSIYIKSELLSAIIGTYQEFKMRKVTFSVTLMAYPASRNTITLSPVNKGNNYWPDNWTGNMVLRDELVWFGVFIRDGEITENIKFNNIGEALGYPGLQSRFSKPGVIQTFQVVWTPTEPSELEWKSAHSKDHNIVRLVILSNTRTENGWFKPDGTRDDRTIWVNIRYHVEAIARGRHTAVSTAVPDPSQPTTSVLSLESMAIT